MSAFIVNEYHIARLVEYGSRKRVSMCVNGRFDRTIDGNEQILFSTLVRANYLSVNHRYDENTPPMPGKYEPDYERVLSPVQVIKACDCFDYQSCEIDNYELTDAARTIDAIRSRAVSALPGYDDAEWEIAPRAINKNIVRMI